MDAGDTALYTLNILDPDASYTSGSGQIYDLSHEEPTSVPEPPTFLLVGLGLAAMAAWGVKYRRVRSV